MIWHIFKKDWKLLWVPAVAVAIAQFLVAAVLYEVGKGEESRSLVQLVTLLPFLTYIGMAFLISMAVLQEALVGVHQDWLVRPVPRIDLLLAKMLFVLLLIQTPMFAADLIQALANGFSWKQSAAAALSRSIYVLLAYDLPVFALASLIRSLSDAVISGVFVFVAVMSFDLAVRTLSAAWGTQGFNPTLGTGVGWVAESMRLVLALVGSAIILAIQFTKRRTILLRASGAVLLFLALFTQILPWKVAFAVEQRVSADSSTQHGVDIRFDPSQRSFHRQRGSANGMMASGMVRNGISYVVVYMPVRISGLRPGMVFKSDRSNFRISGPDGTLVYANTGDDLVFHEDGPVLAPHYQALHIPVSIYDRIKNQDTSLEIDYSASIFRLAETYAIAAVGGTERLPGVGACGTRVDSDGDGIVFHCLQAGAPPTCLAIFLEHAASGRRNPEQFACPADYSPYFGKLVYDDMSRFGTELPFLDLNGLAEYPVDGSMLQDSRVVLRNYEPAGHFTRKIEIPSVTLADWQAQ